MITSRPQTGNLVSLIVFLVIAWILIIVNLLSLLRDPMPPWFNYLVVIALTPVALFIMFKVIFRYKIINMGNGQITITYPQFKIQKTYALKDIVWWTESVIKTGTKSNYKELEIKFSDNRKINMAYREYTEYDKMAGYLLQKAYKFKKKVPDEGK